MELSVDGDSALSGKLTLAAGQTFEFIPVLVKDGTKVGGYQFRVKRDRDRRRARPSLATGRSRTP